MAARRKKDREIQKSKANQVSSIYTHKRWTFHRKTVDFSPKNGGFCTEKRWILHRKTVDFALNTVDSLLEITNSDGVATREAEGRGRENHHLKCKFHHFKCKFHQF